MEQESGILRSHLLDEKKQKIPPVQTRLVAAYKHYLLMLSPQPHQDKDMIVFNAEEGTFISINTGLNLPQRQGFSFCRWKDNIFVLYGGTWVPPGVLYGHTRNDLDVHFLHVIENDGQISIEVESCHLEEPEWWFESHRAQIYQDNMYVFGKESRGLGFRTYVHKFDLREKKWSKCQITGNIPNSPTAPATVLFGNKIFTFASHNETSTRLSNQIFALDLESMTCEKPCQEAFFPERPVPDSPMAELVGDKIYLFSHSYHEFIIYDPIKNVLLESEGFSLSSGWQIRAWKNHSTVFQVSKPNGEQSWMTYQHFLAPAQPEEQENKDPSTQMSYTESLWKEKTFADVTFVVQNEEIPAHKAILIKCPYFQNMFHSEANSNKINAPDISSENFKAILEYIYCDKIDLTEPLAMELIVLADQYCLPKLKADCESCLSAKLTTANFVQVMRAAKAAGSGELEKKIVSFLIANVEKLRQKVDTDLIPSEIFVKAIIGAKSLKK